MLSGPGVKLHDRSVVASSEADALVLVAGDTGNGYIGTDSKVVADVVSTVALELRDRARVNGDVVSEKSITTMNGAVITGARKAGADLNAGLQELATVGFKHEQREPLMREPDSSLELPPGNYGRLHIKSRATVTLSGGSYFFDGLFIEPEALLILQDPGVPTAIAVAGSLTYRAKLQGKSAEDVLLIALGANTHWIQAPLEATLVVPNGPVSLGTLNGSQRHRGAVFGAPVDVAAGATLVHVPFAHWEQARGLFPLPPLDLPEPEPTTTAGPVPALEATMASVEAFVDWVARATPSDMEGARAAVAAKEGNAAIAQLLISLHRGLRGTQPSRAQMVLSVLGELKTQIGASYLLSLVWEPWPTGGSEVRGYGVPERVMAAHRATKALHGIAYMNTEELNLALLHVVSNHPESQVRAEAVRATIYGQGEGIRDTVRAAVRSGEGYFVDRFEARRESPDEPGFDEKLEAYLELHGHRYE